MKDESEAARQAREQIRKELAEMEADIDAWIDANWDRIWEAFCEMHGIPRRTLPTWLICYICGVSLIGIGLLVYLFL